MNQNTNSTSSAASQPSKDRNPWSEPEPEAPAAASSSKPPFASISLVFIVMATLAVMAAMASPAIARIVSQPANNSMHTYLVACGFIGMLVGGTAGATHFRRLEGILWGAPIGVGLGAYIGVLAFTPIDGIEQAILPACVGSVFLVGLAAVVRLTRDAGVKSKASGADSPFDDLPGK